MTEKFLQYLWQHRLFDTQNLTTDEGEAVEIINTGKANTDAGADFFNAKLKIGGTLWAGNVEIHLRSSDWHRHKHDTNKAYDSVILQAVETIDCPVFRSSGEKIPQICMKIPTAMQQRYDELSQQKPAVRCTGHLTQLDALFVHSFLDNLLTERLLQKSEAIFALLQESKNDWEEAFYITLARNFGFGTNSDAFERLAKSLPQTSLGKHKDNLMQLEALLFGQAGLLEYPVDEYSITLKKEYDFLRSKFNLSPLDSSLWKLLRLRPVNFPHIRLAQFAALAHRSSKLFSKIIENPKIKQLHELFAAEPSDYWETHYLFGTKSVKRSKRLGRTAINTILINTVAPFLFCYGKIKQKSNYQDAALNLLKQLPPEKNAIVEEWAAAGIKASSAFDTQALLQLRKSYCDDKKCIYCRIGHRVLTIGG
jgi:hypothetical protein